MKPTGTGQASALGSAMHAGVAAGVYPKIHVAACKIGKLKPIVVEPNPKSQFVYDTFCEEYQELYDYFGSEVNDVIKRLKLIRHKALDVN